MSFFQVVKVAGIACILSALFSAFALAAPVNINTADAKTIAKSLTSIGISKAENIVAYRDEHGAFESPTDIVKVKGIGRKTFKKNQDDILVSSPEE